LAGSADVSSVRFLIKADEDVPKAGNPLSSKLDVELALGAPRKKGIAHDALLRTS
jgi:hypothetical protein